MILKFSLALFLVLPFAAAQARNPVPALSHREGGDPAGRPMAFHRWYNEHDISEMHRWYREREIHHDLPAGLTHADWLPPALAKQIVVYNALPLKLRKKIHPCPEDLVRELPTPPSHCKHVILGGEVVLVNLHTFVVLDFVTLGR